MTEEELLLSEIEADLKERVPEGMLFENEEVSSQLQQVLLKFLIQFRRNERYTYMDSKEKDKDVALHLAGIPKGVLLFEEWFSNSLFNLANNILAVLTLDLPSNTSYLFFSQVLDDKNIESFFDKSEFTENEEDKLRTLLVPITISPELDVLRQALSAMYVGLHNAANSLLKYWAQSSLFDGVDIQKIIDKAKKIEIENKKGTKDSLTSNNIKHNKSRLIEDYTIRKFKTLPKGSFITIADAINLIIDDVINFSLTSPDVAKATGNFEFYNDIKYKGREKERPRANIRRWISKYINL